MKEQLPLDKIRQFVKKKYADVQNKDICFHTFDRAKKLIKAAQIIAGPFSLSDDDRFILFAAVWLHDIGYTGESQSPEKATLRIAGELFVQLKLSGPIMEAIKKLLLIPPGLYQPTDVLEEIMCDAETYYLAKKTFLRVNELLRKELSALQQNKISKASWAWESVSWITDHRYFTEYGRISLEEKKQRNLTLLKAQLSKFRKDTLSQDDPDTSPEAVLWKNKNLPEKGIDTMFRIASANNQRISGMADNKARILITVNAIILSAIISLVLKKLDQETYLAYPTFMLIGVSLITIVFAILAIRPHITSGTFTPEQLENRDVNMLFFGNFHKMKLPDFKSAMLLIMEDNEQVYGTLIHDLYGQGVALGRKYHLLRIAYTLFMFGLVIAMLAFIAFTVFHFQTHVPIAVKLPLTFPSN